MQIYLYLIKDTDEFIQNHWEIAFLDAKSAYAVSGVNSNLSTKKTRLIHSLMQDVVSIMHNCVMDTKCEFMSESKFFSYKCVKSSDPWDAFSAMKSVLRPGRSLAKSTVHSKL